MVEPCAAVLERHDVVDLGGRCAATAAGVDAELAGPGLAPLVVVAALGCGAPAMRPGLGRMVGAWLAVGAAGV